MVRKEVNLLVKEVKNQKYSSLNSQQLTLLLENIGNPDGATRDQGVYTAFYLAVEQDCFSIQQLNQLTNLLVSSDYLMREGNELEDDTVFWRSFSSLFLATILDYDRTKQAFLSAKQLSTISLSLCFVLALEQDSRGYIDEEKGWAHAFAHYGELMAGLGRHPLVTEADLALMMTSVVQKLAAFPDGFQFGEEERLVKGLIPILNRSTELEQSFIRLIQKHQLQLASVNEKNNLTYLNRWYNTRRFYQQLVLAAEIPSSINFIVQKYLTS
ncbi:DUF2785 domain-containing protein [Carnobacterium gallinarum]|uniref:DUF2785 domain-containing protein n=1 Tax=Carnobacterium gallinarum TaxID=2749 RepID=UPI000559021B|nr:DUF2785 domain-containing protein [Carnobacterium gallinarum]